MIQVLLVTGGYHYPGTLTNLDSTEILETSGGSWRTLTTARLPSPRSSLRAGTANNIVFVFGKKYLNVLEYSIFHPIIYYQEVMTMTTMSSTPSSPSTRQRNPGSQLDK